MLKTVTITSRLLHICCSVESWMEMSKAEMGKQKRNASRIQAFHVFSPHGHMMLCQIRALQIWVSASPPPLCQALAKHFFLPARRIKQVAQVHGRCQQGGYLSVLAHPSISAACMCPGDGELPCREEEGLVAMGWGGQHITPRAVTSPSQRQTPCLWAEPGDRGHRVPAGLAMAVISS